MTCGAPSPGGGLICERDAHGDHGHVWAAEWAADGTHDDLGSDW